MSAEIIEGHYHLLLTCKMINNSIIVSSNVTYIRERKDHGCCADVTSSSSTGLRVALRKTCILSKTRDI